MIKNNKYMLINFSSFDISSYVCFVAITRSVIGNLVLWPRLSCGIYDIK